MQRRFLAGGVFLPSPSMKLISGEDMDRHIDEMMAKHGLTRELGDLIDKAA